MDILFVTHHPPFDTRIYHKQFCSLKNHGFDVKIMIPHQKELSQQNDYFISFSGFSSRVFRILNDLLLLFHCRFINPKLIIIFDPDLAPFFLWYKIFSRSVIIYDNHEDYPSYMMEKEYLPTIVRRLLKLFYQFLERIIPSIFDYVIYADIFTPTYYKNINKTNVSVVANYPIVKDLKNLEKKYDVIYPGSLDANYQMVIQIMIELDSRCKQKIKVLIIGRNVSHAIREKIKECSARLNYVELTFLIDQKYNFVQCAIEKSKIGIVPLPLLEKYNRNVSTKLFEYMMYSLVIVASDLPPNRYYLANSKSGFCISEDNFSIKYAEKIIDILGNYTDYLEYAKKK